MKEQTLSICELLAENKEALESAYGWETAIMRLAGAGYFTLCNRLANYSDLIESESLFKNKISFFSTLRGTARPLIVSQLSVSSDPEALLDNAALAFAAVRKYFSCHSFIPLIAMCIAQKSKPEHFDDIAMRTKRNYDNIHKLHPFLTSYESIMLCAFMAMSDKLDDYLVDEAERCYSILKKLIFPVNETLHLGCVLALYDGEAAEKCEKAYTLYSGLKSVRCVFGTDFELPLLGVAAMCSKNYDELIAETHDADKWLSKQSGLGTFSFITSRHRLMYSLILACACLMDSASAQLASQLAMISSIAELNDREAFFSN